MRVWQPSLDAAIICAWTSTVRQVKQFPAPFRALPMRSARPDAQNG
jgi:hypothetical protein